MQIPTSESYSASKKSFHGPDSPALLDFNLGRLLESQCQRNPKNVAVISSWQNKSLTYEALQNESQALALILLSCGVRYGDHIVVLAGNCIEYVQLFFAAAAIGAVFVIINPTFSMDESIAAVEFIGTFLLLEF